MTLIVDAPPSPSVRPSTSVELLEVGDHLDQPTFHERYEAMPPGVKAELIGGIVYMPSPARRSHARHTSIVNGVFHVYEAATPGVEALDNGTAILGQDSEPQPDAALRVVVGGQARVDEYDYIVGCPELVCEVANTTANYDLHAKRLDYERYGAKEYAVAVVAEARVVWFVRDGDRLIVTPPDADGIYRSRVFPGLWVDPTAWLRRDARRVLDVLNQGLASPEHAAFAATLTRPPPDADGGAGRTGV